VGAWEAVFLGRADYLENGVERDWSFKDAVIVDGEVIKVGDSQAPTPEWSSDDALDAADPAPGPVDIPIFSAREAAASIRPEELADLAAAADFLRYSEVEAQPAEMSNPLSPVSWT
jgi:hypothetical protein